METIVTAWKFFSEKPQDEPMPRCEVLDLIKLILLELGSPDEIQRIYKELKQNDNDTSKDKEASESA